MRRKQPPDLFDLLPTLLSEVVDALDEYRTALSEPRDETPAPTPYDQEDEP